MTPSNPKERLVKKPTKPNLPLWEQPGFVPFPDDLNDFTFDLACAVLGGDPDGVLRDIYFAVLEKKAKDAPKE